MSRALNLHLKAVWVSPRSVLGQSQVSLRSVPGQSQSQVGLRSVSGQSQVSPRSVPVSLRSLLDLSELTLSVRRSLKYFVLFLI